MPERTETAYEELGRHDRDTAWTTVEGTEALSVKCEVCKAPKQRKCCNPVTGHPRAIWCVGRTKRSSVPGEERRQ